MENLVIIGTGEAARDATRFVNRYTLYNIVGYACSPEYLESSRERWPNSRVYNINELAEVFNFDSTLFFVAISQFRHLNRERKDIFLKLKAEGARFATLISPRANIVAESVIGQGCWICDDVYIGDEAVVGENTVLGMYSIVSHYCNIGSHVFVGIKSFIMGTVTIGDQCFIGASATIFNNINIGEKCLIGGSTVIKHDVDRCTVCKLPNDLVLQKQYPDEEIENKLIIPQEVRGGTKTIGDDSLMGVKRDFTIGIVA